jgi:hypothetical protein
MGLLKEKECVMGAPSNPTHWLRCKRNILVTPLEPAYAGFMAIVLYMYWVYCESCCAKMLLTEVSSIIQNKEQRNFNFMYFQTHFVAIPTKTRYLFAAENYKNKFKLTRLWFRCLYV